MRINDNLDKRAHLASSNMSWMPSPQPGVDRRMLDRIGDEVARATSIVRYAPGSYFPAHSHGGGEEFLVLEGVFSDEHGDYGSGYYVRNPRGSSHTPFSKNGCTIFVKLWQMEDGDQDFVRIDTQSAQFKPGPIKGIEHLPLHKFDNETVRMEKWTKGASAQRYYAGGAEYLILEGHLKDEAGTYSAGDWLRMPPGSSHDLQALEPSRLYVKTGHLTKVLPLPGA